MELEFGIPWLVVSSAALLLAAAGVGAWRRKPAPVLFVLAGVAFLLAGARPVARAADEPVTHALVLDVSASMSPRLMQAVESLDAVVSRVALPQGHALRRLELSDALRPIGSPDGESTDYARMAEVGDVNGEIILASDGRGELAELMHAVGPARLILLRLPPFRNPDASVVGITGPTTVAEGGTALLRATLHCDQAVDVSWRFIVGTQTVASGSRRAPLGVPFGVSHNYVPDRAGLIRVRLVVEAAGDREPRNDEASLAFFAGSRRVILYCVPRDHPAGVDGLLEALRGLARTEVRVSHDLPMSLRALDDVGLLVINNLPLHHGGATREGTRPIAEWVRAGGNLLMAGAEGAFGPGGYRGTAIEEVMPVTFKPPDAPPQRTLLLLDTSDSMAERLPGGVSKLERLREAAQRVLAATPPTDVVAVVGFAERIRGEVVFRGPDRPEHAATLAELSPGGQTRIRESVSAALEAFAGTADKEARRLLLITDGEETGHGTEADWRELAREIASRGVRVDIVLTDRDPQWLPWLTSAPADQGVRAWPAEADGFGKLLETLDRALAGGDREWLSQDRWEVAGVSAPLHVLAKTAQRRDPSVSTVLSANPPAQSRPLFPVLAWRQLAGRSACLCTRTWGDGLHAAFWGNEMFQERLGMAIDFVTATTNRANLALNALDDGAELVWTGLSEPPQRDLRLSGGGVAQLDVRGRWLLDAMPAGDELLVFDGEVLLQRIPLPGLVPRELQRTGDDEAFFSLAEQAGVRVVRGLEAWQPRRFEPDGKHPLDLTWALALAATAFLIAGFALRKR